MQDTKSKGAKNNSPAKRPVGKSAKVSASNIAKVDPNNPIPFEHGGKAFSYVHSTEYIPFLTPRDNFGLHLLEARMLSTTHNACVTTKRNYCAGNGFQDADSKE